MKELVNIIQNSLEDKYVSLVPHNHAMRVPGKRREFKDLLTYEKEAIGYLVEQLNKYYKIEVRRD